MPNPRYNNDRGPCTTCQAFGGPYVVDPKLGATICLWPAKSGKSVSRLPEVGCAAWVPRQADQPAPCKQGPDFRAQFIGTADPGPLEPYE